MTYTLKNAAMTLATAKTVLAQPAHYSADQKARAKVVADHWKRIQTTRNSRA
jgi:hypothetical protein